MDSQHVSCLTEGYLRGWLTFEYPNKSSYIRESIILKAIQDERIYSILSNKLAAESPLRAQLIGHTKDAAGPVFDILRTMIGLKLPSALPEDKINKDHKEITKSELIEWKEFLDKVNKK